MNPLAVVLIGLGAAMIIIGYRDRADNLIAGITGKPYGKSTLS